MNIIEDLLKYSSPKRKKANEYFFKTGEGGYSSHDSFVGIALPDLRLVVKKYYRNITLNEIESKLLSSKINELRMAGLIILVNLYKISSCHNTAIPNPKISDTATDALLNTAISKHKNTYTQANKRALPSKSEIIKFYFRNLKYVNNWNLVDASTPYILGMYLLENLNNLSLQKKILILASSKKNLWERRIACLSCYPLIKVSNFDFPLIIFKKLILDKEDLINKAVGWMLREIYKKNIAVCENFLIENYQNLNRTTLRYAIEKMPEARRKYFLNFTR